MPKGQKIKVKEKIRYIFSIKYYFWKLPISALDNYRLIIYNQMKMGSKNFIIYYDTSIFM